MISNFNGCGLILQTMGRAVNNKQNDVTSENNTFACFAPWREILFFSLAEAQRPQRTSMFILFLPQTPLRALRPCEILLFFLSQRRRGRQELQCLFRTYPKHLCVLCVSARLYLFFSLAEAQRPPGTSIFISFLPQIPLRALRLGESLFVFISRRGAKTARNFDVCILLTPNTFACFAPWREFICFFLSQRHQDRRQRSIYETEVKKHICLNSEHIGRNSDDQYPVLLITITIKGSGRSASSIGP